MTTQTAPMVEDLRLGCLVVANAESASPLPLEHTDVVAHVSGPLASVSVTQRFGNPFATPVELAYLFPLPHEAAVFDFEFRVGQRVVRAGMKELEEARRTYTEARDQGRRAGLLEQRRPNLFSVELANVQPGETIIATVRYQQRLRYDDGCYSFVFPMGLTPKFHHDPSEATNVDASVASADDSIGTVDISITADAGGLAENPHSPSHQIEFARLDERRFSVRLLGHVIPNKDFVLRYGVADDAVRAAAWASTSEGGATVLVTALPPRLTDEFEPAPREFFFVLDRSGSMMGEPILQARNALRACLRSLGERDTFNIQAFDDQVIWFSESAAAVSQAAVERADQWLRQIEARGGTDILAAIDSALKPDPDPDRQRYVVFLTDGAVSADDEALRRIQRQIRGGRLFTFGIGPSVNRSLLGRMAELGRGTAEFLQLNEDLEEAIIRFQDRVAYPLVQDLTLTWEGVTAWDVYPATLPDLYLGQPLEFAARIRAVNGAGRVIITGKQRGEPVSIEVELPSVAASEPIIIRAWARTRVDSLLDALRDDPNQTGALRAEIIGLAIAHRLITPFTAFVAVDSEVAGNADESRRVSVSVPLPEGLQIEGFFGGQAFIGAVRTAARPLSRQLSSLSSKVNLTLPRRPQVEAAFADVVDMCAEAPQVMSHAREERADRSQTIEERLRWLARTQNVSGSWGADVEEVEQTAAAILAFVRAGHTHRAGNYRRQLARAVKWLLAHTGTGFATRARAQALAELAAATGDSEVAEAAQAAQFGVPPTKPSLGEPLSTLDELREAAITRQVLEVSPALLRGAESNLASVWMAALVATQ